MIKIKKTPRIFEAQMLLKYLGRNSIYNQKRTLTSIKIKEFDTDLGEELVVQHTMFDGTEVLFSIISGNLFLKKEDKIQLTLQEEEIQNFCCFELFNNGNLLVFDGFMSYENTINENFNFKEDFIAIIIMKKSNEVLEIWNKYQGENRGNLNNFKQ